MPEGPELFLTCRYINNMCRGLVFSGRVEKSEVSKNPDMPFASEEYQISATSRGKELKLTLTPIHRDNNSPLCKGEDRGTQGQEGSLGPMDLIGRFRMSGCFKLTLAAEIPKHLPISASTPRRALPELSASWISGALAGGREKILKNLSDKAFSKPICEALLNQKFFNGIGNYLRAEILYRLKIPPFEKARTVLESLQHRKQKSATTLSKKVKFKRENPDLLEFCHRVPMEVIRVDGKGYDPESSADSAAFEDWLQCYDVPGMKSLRDSNGRTIWFQGDPGPLAPKGGKLCKRRSQAKADPEELSPKPGAGRNSKSGTRQEGADGVRGKKEEGKPARENAEDAGGIGIRNRNTRARRKNMVSRESPALDSTAVPWKRRASARWGPATSAAAPRSRRVKVE